MSLHHFVLITLLVHNLIIPSETIGYDYTDELCDKKANCVALNNTKCLDITLSYKYSKLNGLLQDFNFNTEQEVHDYLEKWTGLKSVPRCWASIQPLLCTAFFPKCDSDKVSLLSLQICKNVKINCKILDQFISSHGVKLIPSFLNCNDTNLYQPKCKNDYIDIKFNSSAAHCQYPLVTTDDSNIYYKNIEGCALGCDDPLYHKTDKIAFQNFLIFAASISLIIVLISTISYLPKWSNLSLTSKICFYIQICFAIHYIGWLMQAFINKRQIVCRSDQTLKYSEPNGGGLACLINFVLIYYTSFSISSWYIVMAVTTLNKKFKPTLYKSSLLYLHLCAWSSSFISTIMAIAFSQIDGNYVYGICFISFSSKLSILFVLAPLTIGCLIYISSMLYRAIPVRSILQSSKLRENLIKRKEYKKIYSKLVVSSFLMSFVFVFSYIAFFSKNNDLNEWLESLNEEILCRLNLNLAFGSKNACVHSNCERNFTKSLTLDYWILVFVFSSGICSSFWNFDVISILVWALEFKRRIYKTVRPDKIDERNVFFEKLLHNKQDPVKMNLDTLTTNPVSNNQNNRDLNKTNDSNQLTSSKKLFEQKQLEKKRAKLEVKNQKYDHNEENKKLDQPMNYLNDFSNHNLNAFLPGNNLNHEFSPNMINYTNSQIPMNLPTNTRNNMIVRQPDQLSSPLKSQLTNQPTGVINIAKLNELRQQERERLNIFKSHGMSDQNKVNRVMNPFIEQRRPNSILELTDPSENKLNQANNMAINQASHENSQNSFIVQNANLLQQSQSFNSPMLPMFSNPMFNMFAQPPMMNSLPESQHHQAYLQSLMFNNLICQSYGRGTARDIAEIEAKKREISETIHITQNHNQSESATETNEILPIQITDSDISSLYSIDSRQEVKIDIANEDQIPYDLKEVYDKLKPLNDSFDNESKINEK